MELDSHFNIQPTVCEGVFLDNFLNGAYFTFDEYKCQQKCFHDRSILCILSYQFSIFFCFDLANVNCKMFLDFILNSSGTGLSTIVL